MKKYPSYKFKATPHEDTLYVITKVPHSEQRYETVGDWIPEKDKVRIRVSDLGDERYDYLVVVHELIGYRLAKEHGLTDAKVKAFDEKFEAERARGLHTQSAEAGNDPRAPYRKEHQFATKVEKQLARKLGVDWKKYGKAVESL